MRRGEIFRATKSVADLCRASGAHHFEMWWRMKDARMATTFPGHPKTKKLIRAIGDSGAWAMVKLILWTAENKSDGELTSMTAEDIELAVDWSGESGAFVAAAVKVRFLELTEDHYRLHDWEQHNPWCAGAHERTERARNNANRRWHDDGETHASGTRSARISAARARGTHTQQEWEILRDVLGPACLRCGSEELPLIRNHVIPLYKNGCDSIENIQPFCPRCNAASNSSATDFRPKDWREKFENACKMRAGMPAPSPSPSPKSKSKAPPIGAEVQNGLPGVPELPPPVIDAKTILWREWKRLSGDNGAFLSKMIKQHGEGAVLAALPQVITKNPAEPKAFLRRTLAPNPGRKGRVNSRGYVMDEFGNPTKKGGAVI